MSGTKELSLLKGADRFIFRYEPGEEEKILDSFVDMANDRDNKFDWFDAAVLSFQLSKHLVDQADELLGTTEQQMRNSSTESQAPWGFA
jgi:hypothetical protein